MPAKQLEWKKRAKRVNTELARRRLWASTCGRYHVMEAISNYGLPKKYYALGRSLAVMISDHRTRNAAENACEQHAKNNPEPRDC